MAGQPVTGKVKSGRFKKPVLDNHALTMMGNGLVTQQKKRWESSLNVSDQNSRPLAKKYMFIKAKIRRTNRPKRDLHLSGLLLSNFTLRKAVNGTIRAEATSRAARDHANSANEKDQMIGFAGSDIKRAMDEANAAFGSLCKSLWYPTS